MSAFQASLRELRLKIRRSLKRESVQSSLLNNPQAENPDFSIDEANQYHDAESQLLQLDSNYLGGGLAIIQEEPQHSATHSIKPYTRESLNYKNEESYLTIILVRFYSEHDPQKLQNVRSIVEWTRNKGVEALDEKIFKEYRRHLKDIPVFLSDPAPDSDWDDVRCAIVKFYHKHSPDTSPEQLAEVYKLCVKKGLFKTNQLLTKKYGADLSEVMGKSELPKPICRSLFCFLVLLAFFGIAAGLGVGMGSASPLAVVQNSNSPTFLPTVGTMTSTPTQPLITSNPTPIPTTRTPTFSVETLKPTTNNPTPLPTTRTPTFSVETLKPTTNKPTQRPTKNPNPISFAPTFQPVIIGKNVSCIMTADSEIREVWANGKDITSFIVGNRKSPAETKFIVFDDPSQDATVVFAIKTFKRFAPNNGAGLQVKCESLVSRWNFVSETLTWKAIRSEDRRDDEFESDWMDINPTQVIEPTITSISSQINLGTGIPKICNLQTDFVGFRRIVT